MSETISYRFSMIKVSRIANAAILKIKNFPLKYVDIWIPPCIYPGNGSFQFPKYIIIKPYFYYTLFFQ